ncbi:hypothetical protein JI664_12845 [Rhodobacter sp. NTK016B]|nr:hypothetical protein [Rhodobacter sp. NTK016B]MBN8292855.1 hypothetical protein [Rhodobacter sp. NTK016B]
MTASRHFALFAAIVAALLGANMVQRGVAEAAYDRANFRHVDTGAN